MYADETVENAWLRARGRCECERSAHPAHRGRCNASLVWTERGDPEQEGAWEAVHTGDPRLGGWEAVNLTEILCWVCYQRAMQWATAPSPAPARPSGLAGRLPRQRQGPSRIVQSFPGRPVPRDR